jgi:cytidylate kinase
VAGGARGGAPGGADPLRAADDAVIVDSTVMTIDAVVARVLELAATRVHAG